MERFLSLLEKSPRRGTALDLPRIEQRREGFRHVVEDPFAFLLRALDLVPALAHASRGTRVGITEDVRVSPHELLVDAARDGFEVA